MRTVRQETARHIDRKPAFLHRRRSSKSCQGQTIGVQKTLRAIEPVIRRLGSSLWQAETGPWFVAGPKLGEELFETLEPHESGILRIGDSRVTLVQGRCSRRLAASGNR